MIGYFKEHSSKAWRRCFLKPCDSVQLIEAGTYDPMVWATEVPIPLDLADEKIGLPVTGTAASVNMRELLPGPSGSFILKNHV